MNRTTLYERLIPKDRDLGKIAKEASNNNELLSFLVEGVDHKNTRVKYGCLNTLVLMSETYPKSIYPYFDVFAEYLTSDKTIVKLSGIKILSNLSVVDTDNKIEAIYDTLFAFIEDPEMTPAANLVKGAKTIAKAKPQLKESIINTLLKTTSITYKTEECKNILIGHVINTLSSSHIRSAKEHEILDFIKKQVNNPWKGTATKAKKFVAKFT